MKHILFVIDTDSNSGSKEEMIAIEAFNEKLQSENKLVMAAGIGSSKTAVLIDNRADKNSIEKSSLNGPEFYSGFWIVDADPSEIEQLALAASKACNRRVEIRAFLA